VSEEAKNFWNKNGVVINNPIDTETFCSKKAINKRLKNVLFVSTYASTDILKEACTECGLKYLQIKNEWKIEDLMNDADMIFAVGRGCYEAMSCGREVVIFDKRKYNGRESLADGFSREVYYDAIENNCSGRKNRYIYDKEFIKNEIFPKYDSSAGNINREIILKNHNVRDVCNKFLSL